MREIGKYRGMTKDGKWVYGYLFKTWDQTFILWGTTNGIPDMLEVLPETVGQYTGRKDKNDEGDEVYQHDLVEINNRPFNLLGIYAVVWRKAYGQWWLRSYEKDGLLGGWAEPLMKAAACSYFEVIGNITRGERQ